MRIWFQDCRSGDIILNGRVLKLVRVYFKQPGDTLVPVLTTSLVLTIKYILNRLDHMLNYRISTLWILNILLQSLDKLINLQFIDSPKWFVLLSNKVLLIWGLLGSVYLSDKAATSLLIEILRSELLRRSDAQWLGEFL